MPLEAYFVLATNGRGKPIEQFQPNIDAARVTKDRFIAEGLSDVRIEFFDYKNERSVVE